MNNKETAAKRSKRFRLPKVRLFDIENWREIGATLSRNKTRTFLTGFGIFWGVFMLALLLGGARGGQDMLLRNFAGFATNSAVFSSGTTSIPYRGYAKGRSYNIDYTDLQRIREAVPELKMVSGAQFGSGSFKNGKLTAAGSVQGVFPEFVDIMTPVIYGGRFINQTDVATGRKVAVIGKRIAEQIFPGEDNIVGREVEVNGIVYRIVGIAGQETEISMGSKIDETVIMPITTFQKAFGTKDEVNVAYLVAKDKEKISALKNRIKRVIYSRHYIHPEDESAMWFMDISENFAEVDKLFTGVTLLAGFIGLSSLIAGVIGIGNIMWVIVRERTQEIGVRRALGAKPRDIITQILSEGMALTAVAGTMGIVFAVGVLAILQKATTDPIAVPRFQLMFSQAVWIMVVFLSLGSLAGLIPAIKAMKIKPIEALNDK